MRESNKYLTGLYLENVGKSFSTVFFRNELLPLQEVIVNLQLIQVNNQPFEGLADISETTERLEHAGIKSVSKKNSEYTFDLFTVIAESKWLTLLGEAGAGKSTILQYIGLFFAQPEIITDKQKTLLGIPILIKLVEVYNNLDRFGSTLLDEAIVPKVYEMLGGYADIVRIKELVISWINEGRLVLLLDGMDEVNGISIRKKIYDFTNSVKIVNNRIILTSRPAGYFSPSGDFKEYRIKPLSTSDETFTFIKNWISELKPEWRSNVIPYANELITKIDRNTSLKKIIDNPLLLRLVIEEFVCNETLSNNRAELFHNYLHNVLWNNRQLTSIIPKERKSRILDLLESYAWKLEGGQIIQWDENDQLMVFIRKHLGVISLYKENGQANIVFSHLTFQEYFIANHLSKAWKNSKSRKKAWQIIKSRMHNPNWKEIIELLVQLINDQERSRLIQKIRNAKSCFEDELFRDLFLAISLELECGKENDKEIYQIVLSHLLNNITFQNYWISSDKGFFTTPILLQALNSPNDYIRMISVEALGKIRDKTTIPALIEKLKDPDKLVRRRTVEALGKIGDKSTIPILLQAIHDSDTEVCEGAIFALGLLGDKSSLPFLHEIVNDSSLILRKSICIALGKIGDTSSIPIIMDMLEKKDLELRLLSIAALGKIGDASAVNKLTQLLNSPTNIIRIFSAEALGLIADSSAIQFLVHALQDSDEKVRKNASIALNRIGDKSALEYLVNELNDSKYFNRTNAAQALGIIGDSTILPQLLKSLNDSNDYIRKYAAEAIGQIRDASSVPALVTKLNDDSPIVRNSSAQALGRIRDNSAVPYLLKALINDNDQGVRQQAALAIGNIEDSSCIPTLVKLLNNPINEGRFELAAKTLSFFANNISDISTLRICINVLLYKKDWNAVKKLLSRCDKIIESKIPFDDPLVIRKNKNYLLLRKIIRILQYFFLIVIIGTLSIGSGIISNLFSEDYLVKLRNWIDSHIFVFVVILIFAFLIEGLAQWRVYMMEKEFESPDK